MTACKTCGGLRQVMDLTKVPRSGTLGEITAAMERAIRPCPDCRPAPRVVDCCEGICAQPEKDK